MKPDCSIVIRAYNEENHIGRLLTGILEQSLRKVQVILVDSGSTDATTAVAAGYPVEVVHIKPQDFTFGRSLNLGLAQARAEKVVIASAHVYPVYPDWLERLLEPFADDQVAVTYGKQRGAASSKYSEHQLFRRWFPEHSTLRQAHPFSNNANAAIRRAVWERQPYDEALPGLEDLAWTHKAQELGFAVAYVAEAEVVHIHNETWPGIYNRYRREGMAFKKIYPQETFGFTDFIRLWLVNVWSDWRAAAAEGALRSEWSSIIRFRLMQFLGTYQGYRQSGPLTWHLRQTFYYPRLKGELEGVASKRTVQPINYEG